MIELFIPGKPISKKRPRFFRRGSFVGTYNAQETEEGRWMLEAKSQLPAGFVPLSGAISMKIQFAFPYPSSFSKRLRKEQPWHWNTKKPDIDNLDKWVLDCLRNFVMGDDSCVVKLESEKFYSDKAGTRISIKGDQK